MRGLVPRVSVPPALATFALLLAVGAPQVALAQAPLSRHEAELKQLDAALASADPSAAVAVLRRMQPRIDADERLALDTIYVLLGRQRLAEAKDQWNRLAPKLRESLQGAAPAAPAADEARRRRVAEAMFVQALLTARAGGREESLRLLRQADGLGFPPLDSPLMRLAADCLAELREPRLAAQAYREIVERSPDDVPARLGLGASLLASGQVAAAEDELQQVLRRRPEDEQAHALLGAALLEERRVDEARTHLERALAKDARCVPCMARLAQVAYLAGDDARCESWLGKASAIDPSDLESSLVRGMLEGRKGRYDLAIEQLTRVVEQAPDLAKAQYQLALAYRRAGNAAKAREHQEIYDRLVREPKARTLGVRGAE
jgi:tetratricopeptide (TPR) repeat protein